MFFYHLCSLLFPHKYNNAYLNNCTPYRENKNLTIILFSYRDINVKKLIFSMKKYHDTERDTIIARKISQRLLLLLTNSEPVVIIPMPISKNTLKKRGFNQVENIARKLSYMHQNIIIDTDIVRKKDTKKQAQLSKKDRFENSARAFYLHKYPYTHTIIILDDVITTGSTMQSIEKILLDHTTNIIKVAVAA